jgi:hypothetical protein
MLQRNVIAPKAWNPCQKQTLFTNMSVPTKRHFHSDFDAVLVECRTFRHTVIFCKDNQNRWILGSEISYLRKIKQISNVRTKNTWDWFTLWECGDAILFHITTAGFKGSPPLILLMNWSWPLYADAKSLEEEEYEIRIVFRILLTTFDSDSNIVLIAISTTFLCQVSVPDIRGSPTPLWQCLEWPLHPETYLEMICPKSKGVEEERRCIKAEVRRKK